MAEVLPGDRLATHVVVAVSQEVSQSSLSLAVHMARLGQAGVPLEVGDSGDRLGPMIPSMGPM